MGPISYKKYMKFKSLELGNCETLKLRNQETKVPRNQEAKKLVYFQVRESPPPLSIPTPIPAPAHPLGDTSVSQCLAVFGHVPPMFGCVWPCLLTLTLQELRTYIYSYRCCNSGWSISFSKRRKTSMFIISELALGVLTSSNKRAAKVNRPSVPPRTGCRCPQ